MAIFRTRERTPGGGEAAGSRRVVTAGRLAALNAGLLALLAAVHFGPQAMAQQDGEPTRGRGEYIVLAAEPEDGNLADVFIVDLLNQEVVALKWDPQRDNLLGIGYQDIGVALETPRRGR